MNYELLKKLGNKLFFSVSELAESAGIRQDSARVLAARYSKKGLFIRLKNNMYTAAQKWPALAETDFFRLANLIQVPSYISFMSALAYYEITSQVRQNFFESACIKRSVKYNAGDASFNFYKLKKDYYSGFVKKDDFFIATPEKAFLDSVYLFSAGKYRLDFASLDLRKLDNKKIKELLKIFPAKTGKIAGDLCRI